MMNVKVRKTFTDSNDYGCVSVLKETYIEHNGAEIKVEDDERRAFNPSQVEEIKDFAPELYEKFRDMCTPEVMKAWEDFQKKVEENFV